MLSLYIHIPFCDKKCGYCSFNVIPLDTFSLTEKIQEQYVTAMTQEIQDRASKIGPQPIKTIYFGGGTPTSIGASNIMRIVDAIHQYFDCENIAELSIECNPYPEQQTLDFIQTINTQYNKIPRVRFSIGIQTFDHQILQESNRQYAFPAIRDFCRALVPLKKEHTVFNLDLIAFGKIDTEQKANKTLWDDIRRSFFKDLLASKFFDSFSLYTLELFPGSDRYNQQITQGTHAKDGYGLKKYGSDDDVYDEFHILKEQIQKAGYTRYEVSNFSHPGKNSIHNRVYRDMENYIGIGTSASSFIDIHKLPKIADIFECPIDTKALRRTNTKAIADYFKGDYIDSSKTVVLSDTDYTIEKMMLGLRTDRGIENLSTYKNLLESNRESLVQQRQEQGFVFYDDDYLVLTDTGLDLSNTIITQLIKAL